MTSRIFSVLLEQRKRIEQGDPCPIEQLLEQYPEIRDDPEQVLDLIYAEIVYRSEQGNEVDVAEYCRRFPEHAKLIEKQVAVDRVLSKLCYEESQIPTSRVLTISQPVSAEEGDGPGSTVTAGGDFARSSAKTPRSLPNIPGYRIVRVIGRGGHGMVYEAIQESLDRRVALKMLRPSDDNSLAGNLDFLKREAMTIAQIRHPNVTHVYDFGVVDDQAYFTLELVEGGNLSQQIRSGAVSLDEALRIATQLADGIAAIHRHGVIHRDLKPSNVLLTESGDAKIADFGLAKWVGSSFSITKGEGVVGTAPYMSPEQARGDAEITAASDIFSFGTILYEMLTGRQAFPGGRLMETLAKVCHSQPTPPRELNPDIPAALEAICLRCLEKEPAKRYASAQELREALTHATAGTASPPAPTRHTPWLPRLAMTACTAFLLVISVAMVGGNTGMQSGGGKGGEAVLPNSRGEVLRSLKTTSTAFVSGAESFPGPFRIALGQFYTFKPLLAEPALLAESIDPTLVEFLDRVPAKSYSFSCELRHDRSAPFGSVGAYLGYVTHQPAGRNPVGVFFRVTFFDKAGGPGRAERIQLQAVHFRREPAGPKLLPAMGLNSFAFKPANAARDDPPWRQLKLTVGPEKVDVYFGDAGEGLQYLGATKIATIHKRMRDYDRLNGMRYGDVITTVDLQGGLGVYVENSRALFRNVTLSIASEKGN